MYQSPQKKTSSWSVTSIQKKSKSFSKPGSSAVQASRDANSAESQDMPSYSTPGADLLAGSIMRSVETEEHSEVETSTGKRQSEPGRAAVAATAPPIVSIPVVQPNSVGIQAKLTVGAIGDVYEQEADRVAAQVMSMPFAAAAGPQVQRFGEEPSPVQMYSSLARSITPVVQRRVDEQVQMRSLVQRAFQAGGNQASGDLESRLNASKGGGSALAPEVRAFMEPRFGADFSSVRVHTGGEAVQMNRELGAQAFAHGSDIYFGAGKSPGNNELTAHELTHVVQQTGGVQTKLTLDQTDVQRKCSACEQEEETVQRSLNVSAASELGIQRWSLFGDDEDKTESESSSSGGILDWVEQTASGAVDSVTQAGSDAYDWAKEKGGAAVDTVTQAGSDAYDWAKEKGGAAVDTITQAGSDAYDWAKEKGSAAVDTVTQAGSDAYDWAKETGSAALDLATDVGGQALDLISNAGNVQVDWNSAPGKIVKAWASQLDPELVQNIRGKNPADLYKLVSVPAQVQQAAEELAKQASMNTAQSAAPTSSTSGVIQMYAPSAAPAPVSGPVSAPGPVSGVRPVSPPPGVGPSAGSGVGRVLAALLSPIGAAIIVFLAIMLIPSNIFEKGNSEDEYLEEAREKQYQEAIDLVDQIIASLGVGGTKKVPVKPAGLSQSDSELWDDCKGKHDEYEGTKQKVGELGAKIKAIGKDIPKLTIDQKRSLCALIDSLLPVLDLLSQQRRAYIDVDCDKFDWFNEGRTAQERKDSHEGAVKQLNQQIENLKKLRGKLAC